MYMTDIFNTAAVKASGLDANHPRAAVLSTRDYIMAMTQRAHDAALTPKKPGGLSHGERAALSCRMARLNEEAPLAAHFEAMIGDSNATQIADLAFDGGDDERLCAVLRHTDLATTDTKSVVAADIAALVSAGVSEDDIIRLSELVAFVNYQVRLTIGLRLMGDAS